MAKLVGPPRGGHYVHAGRSVRRQPDSAASTVSSPITGAGTILGTFQYMAPEQPNLDYHPVWAPSGKALYYLPGAGSSLTAVGVQMQPGVTFGTPAELRAVLPSDAISTQVRGYDVLPDGRVLIAIPHVDANGADAKTELRVVQNWFEELKRLVPAN